MPKGSPVPSHPRPSPLGRRSGPGAGDFSPTRVDQRTTTVDRASVKGGKSNAGYRDQRPIYRLERHLHSLSVCSGFHRRPGERLHRLRRRLCVNPRHDEPGGPRHRGRGQQHVPQVPQGHGGGVQALEVRPGGHQAGPGHGGVRGPGSVGGHPDPGVGPGQVGPGRLQPLCQPVLRGHPGGGGRLRLL